MQIYQKAWYYAAPDKAGKIKQRDELWELDIDTRIWRLLKPGGNSPGIRTGHTMFAWKNAFIYGAEVRTMFMSPLTLNLIAWR